MEATYNGSGGLQPSTGTRSHTVNKGNTTTTISLATNPSVVGQSVTLTASVSPVTPATGTPGGTVQFKDAGVDIGSPVPLTSGSAALSTAFSSTGSHAITAVYSGDATFNASTGAATQTVNKATTTTAVASDVNPSSFGQVVTFTATVTPVAPGAGTPGGTVQFRDNGVDLGAPVTLADGCASFTTSSLTTGTHNINAVYSGDANFIASNGALTQTVNKADAVVTLNAADLVQTYNATPRIVGYTTTPAGLTGVSLTYNGSPTAPTTAGTYTVVAALNNANYEAPNAIGTLTVNKATATLTLGNLTHTYDGSPKSATVTSNPTDLTGISITYNGSPTPPTNAGNYLVVASLTNTNYEAANAIGTLVINKAAATITLADLEHTYDGSPKSASATTNPAGLSGLSITYNGSSTPPTNAGNYAVVATLTNTNYEAPNASGTLVIGKATASITLADLAHTYNGSPKSATATTSPAGLSGVSITYDGSSTAPTNAGNYAVVATLTNTNYEAPNATGTLVIGKATAVLTLGNLAHTYDGTAKAASATTSPAGLTIVSITYNGSTSPPTNAGDYNVAATLTNANYEAPIATGVLTIAKANQAIAVTSAVPATAIYATTFNTAATGGGSGNGVAITAGGVCSVSAGGVGSATIQMVSGTGTCTVYYNQAGTANYNPAPQVAAVTAAVKAAQSIVVTTNAPAMATFGSSFTVAATGGGSGNPVTYTTPPGDGCSDAGPTFTVTSGVVACQVQYNQAGNANYAAATQVVQLVGTVGYAFEGFFSPIDMSTAETTVWNRASAGQAIPVKWRLTLASVPVASGASFVGLFSQEVSCMTGTAEVEYAIEEYAPGASGLIYDGDGRFHFNWKTPTTYKNKCRAMYVSFSDGSVSPIAIFKFK
jgi:hypothetical protein